MFRRGLGAFVFCHGEVYNDASDDAFVARSMQQQNENPSINHHARQRKLLRSRARALARSRAARRHGGLSNGAPTSQKSGQEIDKRLPHLPNTGSLVFQGNLALGFL